MPDKECKFSRKISEVNECKSLLNSDFLLCVMCASFTHGTFDTPPCGNVIKPEGKTRRRCTLELRPKSQTVVGGVQKGTVEAAG